MSDGHARASRNGALVTDDGIGTDVDGSAGLKCESPVDRAPRSEAHMSSGCHREAKAPADVTACPEASARMPKTDHGQTESPAHVSGHPDSRGVGHRKTLAVGGTLQSVLSETVHGEEEEASAAARGRRANYTFVI